MVELKNFTKKYNGFLAADNISCSFEKNLITGILGPNGAGKTTILKAISGRHFPTDGHIFIDSQKYGKIESCEEPAKVRNITGTEYIQAYVTSEKYPDVTFDAWIDRMTKEVTDDYLSMLIGFRIQQKLTEDLNEFDIKSYSKVTLLLKNKQTLQIPIWM